MTTSPSSLECSTCKMVYHYKEELYWDLTVGSGSTYSETTTYMENTFRSALVCYIYKRAWRQLFALAGFPGPCKEPQFEHAKDYLKPAGGVIVDASCGAGPFSRLFIKSKLYSQVVALDFSANMLKECNKFIKKEKISDEGLVMVKADISRLPFTTNSVDAVHAGCALHCWPAPSNAVLYITGIRRCKDGLKTLTDELKDGTWVACMITPSEDFQLDSSRFEHFKVAEISGVLRPGGVFVASTFIIDVVPLAIPAFRIGRKNIGHFYGYKTFLSEDELEGLCKACGLVDFKCVRKGLYVMLSAN